MPAEDRSGAPKPRQLPGDARGFVNRTDELRRLNAILADREGDPLVVSVCVIAGTAGAGKTSLALRWAHQIAERFPDGQLYVNLRGYAPEAPVTPVEALHRFLSALGVPTKEVPDDLETAAAHYRSLLADRRMLVVLDNANSASQVRPLLPGRTGSLVVVTSRSHLSGLAVREGARRLPLGTLPEPEAVALLRAVTADYRPSDDEDKLRELARLCARLPLALRIAAERAASHPHMRLDDLIADLRDESSLWDALSVGDEEEADAVRTVFAWSYRALPEAGARLFRLLGLHPGPEIGLHAAAALAATGIGRTRRLLDTLVGAHLLEQTAPDRFEFHDLLRAYAADQAQEQEPGEERRAALRRVLDWYLRTADAAQGWIQPAEARVPLGEPEEGVAPLSFASYDEAVDWSEREQVNFLPVVRAAERAGLHRQAWQLAAVLWNAQRPSAPVGEWLPVGEIGLRAARHLGDRAAQAGLLESFGMAHTHARRLAESRECHEGALAIRRELADRLGVGLSLNALGLIDLRTRRLRGAAERFEEALGAFRELGEAHWEATALSNLAVVQYEAGLLQEAAGLVERALAAHRALGNDRGEGNALRVLAAVQRERGAVEDAVRSAEQAVEIAHSRRSGPLEGYWLLELGAALNACGRHAEALEAFHRSAVLHRRLGNRSREALAWQGTGETCRLLGRFGEAADFHRRAAAVHAELGDDWQRALALHGLATALCDGAGGGAEPGEDAKPGAVERAVRYWAEAERLLAGYEDARAGALRARVAEAAAGAGRP
ncbi:tetratricopeptide repeat protein [Streptomyces sodiiphilus]|uniref:Tetratricopeptide repeat protein n=1 Tax=Streptomyces sodiiphilus TaxID=226217 RepID=A0ABP5AAB4_9ACTN